MSRMQFIAVTVAIALSVAFAVSWYVTTGKGAGTYSDKKDVPTDFEITDEVRTCFENARYISLQKVERICTDYEDGSFDADYSTYLVSDVDLKVGEDHTQEYSKAFVKDGLKDDEVVTKSFEEAFGFSYAEKNAWQVFDDFLKVNGISGDVSYVDFDEDVNDVTGQKLYVLKERCSILDEMTEGIDESDIVESKVFYQTTESIDGIEIPEGITAYAQYKSGSSYITKTIYLQPVKFHLP